MPAANAKIVRLTAKPAQAADLSLPVEGIVDEVGVKLGDAVTAFDRTALLQKLDEEGSPTGAVMIATELPAYLRFGPQMIRAEVGAKRIASLRSTSLAALLDKAILARANAYNGRYRDVDDLMRRIRAAYSSEPPENLFFHLRSKPQLLQDLYALSGARADLVSEAYAADGLANVVVRSTGSVIDASFTEKADRTGGSHSDEFGGSNTGERETDAHLEATGSVSSATSEKSTTDGTLTDHTDASSVEHETVTNLTFDYRVPSIESSAQDARAQISLIDERFDSYLLERTFTHLEGILGNELAMLDLDVRRLQSAFLDTLLTSPIDGVCTAILKNPGERVSLGEVVARVESDERVLLVGTVVHRGFIKVGDAVSFETRLFGDANQITTIAGSVVSAAGDGLDESRWDVVVDCSNRDANGGPVLPPHYAFAHDDTTVTIT